MSNEAKRAVQARQQLELALQDVANSLVQMAAILNACGAAVAQAAAEESQASAEYIALLERKLAHYEHTAVN